MFCFGGLRWMACLYIELLVMELIVVLYDGAFVDALVELIVDG